MNKIKPCPCCNSRNVCVFEHRDWFIYHYVACRTCGIQTPLEIEKEEAIKKWNRRPTDGEEAKKRIKKVKNERKD